MARSLMAARFVCNTRKKQEIFQRQINLPLLLNEILNRLRKEPKAQIFLTRVSKKDAPNYYDVIKRPMDLGTVGKKIIMYRTIEEFKDDLDLIWNNCLAFNTTQYFIDCAKEMREAANTLLMVRGRVYPSDLEEGRHEGLEINNVRGSLERWVVTYLKKAGFTTTEKQSLNILVDLMEHRIVKDLKNHKKVTEPN